LIPAAPPPPAVAAPAPKGVEAARIGGTVLIVDDEEIVRTALKRALTRFGYKVLEAMDGPTAMAAMQGANPPVDLVILDMVLPGLAARADGFLPKPYEIRELKAAVSKALRGAA